MSIAPLPSNPLYITIYTHFSFAPETLLPPQHAIDLAGMTLKLVVKGIVAPEKHQHLIIVVNWDDACCCLIVVKEAVPRVLLNNKPPSLSI